LGHVINNWLLDSDDVSSCKTSLGQTNSVLCNFSMLSCTVQVFYGCQLWDLNRKNLVEFCIAWMKDARRVARRVWSLPYDACCGTVYLLARVIPVYDEICRRVINFIQSCWNSDSEFVKYIVYLGINGSRMQSPIGRNAGV